LIEQAPGDGASGPEHAGLALLHAAMDQLHMARHYRRPANSSVHTRNSPNRRTALGNQAHNMLPDPANKGWVETWQRSKGVSELSGVGGRRTAHLNRAHKTRSRQRRKQLWKPTKEGNEEKTQSGGSPLTLGTGSLFSLGPSMALSQCFDAEALDSLWLCDGFRLALAAFALVAA
jgi:hypothetical protein